jgi:hypothetical protein
MATPKPVKRTVATIFPKERLKKLNASKNVREMTPADFDDMAKVFTGDTDVKNAKVSALTTLDLVTLESLFSDYRTEIIANYGGPGGVKDALNRVVHPDGCCCCCTPCCCCGSTPPKQK